MRIISNFKDYYDCIQKYGQDDLVYLRKTEEKIVRGSSYRLIGFCGQLYPMLRFQYQNDTVNHYCFTVEHMDKLAERFTKSELDIYYEKTKYKPWSSIYRVYSYIPRRESLPEFFSGIRKTYRGEEDMIKTHRNKFDEYDIPIFEIKSHERLSYKVILNPRLNQYGFERVVPPYQAFQELMKWFSNRVKPFRPIPEVSDKDLAAAKGYDKFSFRKAKQK